VNDFEFKKKNKPAVCTRNPVYHLIPYKNRLDVLRQIKQECIDIYGSDIMSECPKRFECGEKCIGRPLAWKSPTARPYLEKLAETQNIASGELFVLDCSSCPIASTCIRTCNQINDFMAKTRVREPVMINDEHIEIRKAMPKEELFDLKRIFPNNLEIPWDCVNETRRQAIEMYVMEGKDFSHIAKLLYLYNQAEAKYEFYAGLTTLSKYAIIREFILNKKDLLTENQLNIMRKSYIDNLTFTEIAAQLGITKQAVQQTVDRVVKANKLKWTKFVRKEGNKTIYNTTEIFR